MRYLKERDKNPSFRATIQIPAGKFIPTAETNGERWGKSKIKYQQQRSCLLSKVNHRGTGCEAHVSSVRPTARRAGSCCGAVSVHVQPLLAGGSAGTPSTHGSHAACSAVGPQQSHRGRRSSYNTHRDLFSPASLAVVLLLVVSAFLFLSSLLCTTL